MKLYGVMSVFRTFSLFKFIGGYDFTEEFVKQFHFILQHTSGRVDGVFCQMNNSIMHTTEPFSLYALMRLHYSILTSSDYLATAHYINSSLIIQ